MFLPCIRKPLAALTLVGLVACATGPSPSTLNEVRATANPTDRPQRSITNFTPALRCMDDMMFAMGTRDISMMMEEFRDATQKVPLSARDMMTSAMSDMTRRSRGVRLMVFGTDQNNLTQFLQLAQKSNAFAVVPTYNIRGTISQLDETVKKSGGSVGVSAVEALFGVRFGTDTKFSVLGLDAALVETSSMTLIPGVSSKNTTVISSRDASAGDGQARLANPAIGLVFAFETSRADGPAQAARNMIELATLELVGKLIHAPYWQCVGTPDTDPEVQREMEDWFLSMGEDEQIRFYQDRMRERRYYNGAIDGQSSPAFMSAMATYRKALKLPAQGALDLPFFKQFVTTAVPRGPLASAGRGIVVGPGAAPVRRCSPHDLELSPAHRWRRQKGHELGHQREPGWLCVLLHPRPGDPANSAHLSESLCQRPEGRFRQALIASRSGQVCVESRSRIRLPARTA